MGKLDDGLMDRWLHRRTLTRWGRVAREAADLDPVALQTYRTRARQIRQYLDRVLYVADGRLTKPLVGARKAAEPSDCDWVWRPELWSGPLPGAGIAGVETTTMIGQEAKVFHDCPLNELTIRQLRNAREEDQASFGLRLDDFRFDGSFLSIVLDLPPAAVNGLTKRHLIRLDPIVEMEKPLEIFARLNVKHGPNTDQIVRELPLHEDNRMVEFDLAYTKMNEKRVERMWVDLIFERPEMNQVVLRDLTFSRRPRAEL